MKGNKKMYQEPPKMSGIGTLNSSKTYDVKVASTGQSQYSMMTKSGKGQG
jgi:hypothetical protein|tara:strand:+ start:802 stop:951 length:150 start_codon:yes stop_codon:yes gene_type:complete